MKNKLKPEMLVLIYSVIAFAFAFAPTCYAQSNNNATALDYGSYGAQMNRQQLNRGSGLNNGNLHIGELKIHPTFHERLVYDDNVYKVSGTHRRMEGQDSITTNTSRANEGKEGELINIASPGVRLELPLGERLFKGKIKRLGLNWQSDFKNYTDDNANLNQDNHYVVGSVTLEVLKGYELTLNHNFQHSNVGAGSETDQLHARDTNSFGVALKMSQLIHSLKKLDVTVSYRNFDQDYSETHLERANRNQDDYSIAISYKLTPKLSINFPTYTYSVINYDKHRQELASSTTDPLSDSHTNTLSGGFSWKATAKTTGYFTYGYTNREYEKDSHQGFDTAANFNWKTSDVNSSIMKGGLTSRLPWNMLLDVNIFRQLREAEFTAKSNSYFSTGGNFTISKKYRKFFTDFTAGYFKTDFNGVNREDDIYFLAANATYAITKWSQIEAGYSYRDKRLNSDFDQEEEQISQAYIGFGLGL